jgi:acyl-coenzyme A synthetase/AMP-(fatty) acid ligase
MEQHPRELPDLLSVSPTGDFVKKELVQRWFAAQPKIRLVNTYGLTETSDDAVHEVMGRARSTSLRTSACHGRIQAVLAHHTSHVPGSMDDQRTAHAAAEAGPGGCWRTGLELGDDRRDQPKTEA